MARQVTCLVTIHGIGFQQGPQDGTPGYADGLHDRLRGYLPDLLGGDPAAEWGRPKGVGAIYVHSDWPPDTRKMEQGLARLGRWKTGDQSHREIDTTDAPIADDDHPVAHIALVYSHLQDQGPHLGATVETLVKAVVSQSHYATLGSMARMMVVDGWAIAKHRMQAPPAVTPSLRVRSPAAARQGDPSGLIAVVQQLENDIATYINRNDLRDRVRTFVHEALLRLCSREDVSSIVVNSHSQGTIVAFDVLRELPPFALEKVRCYLTAGSPLRKYSDIFYWGDDAAGLCRTDWWNFWDATDPVADPLVPPASWRPGDPVPPSPGFSQLYHSIDPNTGEPLNVNLVDFQVDNAAHGASGGLPAHNYWDNDDQFVRPLAGFLRQLEQGAATP